jgi:hypothetical protein
MYRKQAVGCIDYIVEARQAFRRHYYHHSCIRLNRGYQGSIGTKVCFAAMLYVRFNLLHPDVSMDLSRQHGLNDFYMRYKMQSECTLNEKVRYGSPRSSTRPNAVFTDNSVRKRGQEQTEKET